jgi:hypothetical protein
VPRVHAAPAADDPLDVAGGAGAADGEETLFGLWRGHAGERPHLGVRELASREGLGQSRQGRQGARHAHAFPGCAQVEPDAPAQPGGARGESRVPAAAGVELADEIEQARGRRFEMRGKLGDLVTQAIDRCVVDAIARAHFHGEPPFAEATLHPSFGGAWKAGEVTNAPRTAIFR